MISAAFGRPFCFFSPEQRPTRPHGAPLDAPHAPNGGHRAGHLAYASTQAGVLDYWVRPLKRGDKPKTWREFSRPQGSW